MVEIRDSFDMQQVQRDAELIREQGYAIIENVLSEDVLVEIRAALAPNWASQRSGRNPFEGYKTERVYALVGQHRIFEALATHARILALCDQFLAPNYLLTVSQGIRICPGERPQPLHSDDAFYLLPRPRPAISLSTIFAIDAFTENNGATQIIPGSHHWGEEANRVSVIDIDFATRPQGGAAGDRPSAAGDRPSAAEYAREPALQEHAELLSQIVDVIMPAGSVVVFLGTLLHRGGGNRGDEPRLALSNQYCQPWARQQENHFLAIPRARACQMSERLQALLGYSIHPPFIGHANGMHPRRFLRQAASRGAGETD